MGLWGKIETRGRLSRETRLARSANTDKDLADSCHLSLFRSTIDQNSPSQRFAACTEARAVPKNGLEGTMVGFLGHNPGTGGLRKSFEQFRPTQGGRTGPNPDLPRTNFRWMRHQNPNEPRSRLSRHRRGGRRGVGSWTDRCRIGNRGATLRPWKWVHGTDDHRGWVATSTRQRVHRAHQYAHSARSKSHGHQIKTRLKISARTHEWTPAWSARKRNGIGILLKVGRVVLRWRRAYRGPSERIPSMRSVPGWAVLSRSRQCETVEGPLCGRLVVPAFFFSASRRGRLATSFQPDLSWFLDLDPESIGWPQVLGWRWDTNSSCRNRLLAAARNFPWLRRCGSALPSGRVPQAGMPGRPSGKEGSSCVARWHQPGGGRRGPGGRPDAPRRKVPAARAGRLVSRWSCSMPDPGEAGPQLAGFHVSTRYAVDG